MHLAQKIFGVQPSSMRILRINSHIHYHHAHAPWAMWNSMINIPSKRFVIVRCPFKVQLSLSQLVSTTTFPSNSFDSLDLTVPSVVRRCLQEVTLFSLLHTRSTTTILIKQKNRSQYLMRIIQLIEYSPGIVVRHRQNLIDYWSF